MTSKRKALLLTACAVLLVVASVFGTLAYLTDTESVKNVFTVGQIGLTLDEAKVNQMGVRDGDIRWQPTTEDPEQEYHLLPGHTYVKDPKITVDANSEDCYLFVVVANGLVGIEDESINIAAQLKANGWIAVNGVENTYVYVGTAAGATDPLAVSKNDVIHVFGQFKVDEAVNNTTLAAYAGKNVTVTAYAVQEDGFEGKSAAVIWDTAF